MRTRLALAAFSVAMGSLLAGHAHAALVTDSVSFSANTFQTAFGDPAPVDPVTGSFTIKFDPTQTYTNATSGITLKTLNIALGSALSFSYDPNHPAGTLPAGTLIVGGSFDGPGMVQYQPTTSDFWLFITGFTTTPAFYQLGYSQVAALDRSLFYTINGTGSVTVTPVTTPGVPEPATWAMMILGFGLLGGAIRRRKATAGYGAT
jgi:hypothetical protein